MVSLSSCPELMPGSRVHIDGVSWPNYTEYLHLFADSPRVRLTYDRGKLELMSPLHEHDFGSRILAYLVQALTQEMGLPFRPGGSTTLRRRLKLRGLEPDECFWIQNAAQMAGRRRVDLTRDPPPDLAIEVVVTHSLMDRIDIYADLGVPEVWQLERNRLTAHLLQPDSTYRKSKTSRAFAGLAPKDLMPFLAKARNSADDNLVLDEFRSWLKRRKLAT
jgi:Uma2 family endonuclease